MLNPAGSISSLPINLPEISGGSASPTASAAFNNLVQGFVNDTNTQQIQADVAVERLATGQTDSVHETMMALAKADLSLRMFMEVRNKVIDAYQEVMRMQL